MKFLKTTSLFAAAMTLCGMAACSSGSGRPLSEIDDATPADSLMYYFGEMRGSEYKREASRDSTLASEAARKAYLAGVEAGLKAAKADDEAYNRGLYLGMQMAMNMNQFSKDYNTQLSPRIFLDGLAQCITTDSVSGDDAQREFHRLMNAFNEQKETRDREAAETSLKAEAAKLKLTELAPSLYGTPAKAGVTLIKEGDKVTLTLVIDELDGKPVPAPMPKELTVGQRMKNSPLTPALETLSPGEQGTFLTTAQALFGPRCGQMKIQPSTVLKLRLSADLLTE